MMDGLTWVSERLKNDAKVNKLRIGELTMTQTPPSLPPPAPIQQLHHYAYRAKDAEETRHFYEDILGLPLFHIIQSDIVPSTGEYCPYTHFFFRLQDGSFIAFFDLGDDEAALPSANTPLWVNHISFRVNTVPELQAMKARLEAEGIEVLGVTDHHIFKSIYFLTPTACGWSSPRSWLKKFTCIKKAPTYMPAWLNGRRAKWPGVQNARHATGQQIDAEFERNS